MATVSRRIDAKYAMIFVKLLFMVAQAIILITHTSADSIQPPSIQRAKSLQYNDRTWSHRRNGSYHHDLDVCGSPVLARSKIPVPADQAAHIWDTDHICAPAKYWRLTPETMRESGAQAFFLDWFEAYQLGKYQDECDGAHMTAIQCFASMWWGDFDFQCTVDQIERCAVPTTSRITTWIQGRYNWPPAQVTETARKVLFIYKHFQIAISDLKTDWDVISRMGSAVALEAHFAVDNFTPQHNSVTQAYCDVAKAVSEIAVDMALQFGVVGVNLGQFTGSFRAMSKAADDLMATAHKTGDYREAVLAAQKLNMARQSMYYTQWATGEARKAAHAAQEVTDAYQHAKGSVIPEREKPRLEFPLIKGYGPCGNIFGVIDDNTHSQVDQLVLFVNQHLHGLRYAVEELFNSFFIKDHEDLGDIALQDVMKINNWPGVSTRSYEGLEVTVKAAIKNLIISELLAASRQYLKCEERDDAAEACEQDKALQFTIRRALYCPPDHPKLRCQAGRITKKQILNHDKDLIALQGGSDKFASNGIDLFGLYSNSLERYFVMGTDSYSPRGLYIQGNVVDPSKMAYLPVTVSKVKTVHPGELHMNFPYSCGDWTSNCTAAFLDRVNVDIQHEWEMRTTILTNHLKLIHEPANRFLLLCNLGLRMPHSGGDITTQVVRLDPSPICKRVKNAIQDKDELEGNYRFCTLDVVREYAFKHERVGTIGGLHSHKVLCQKWIFANNLEIEKRFGSFSV